METKGAAFSRQLPVERIFRNARAGWVMAPTADHLRDFIGRTLTGRISNSRNSAA